MKDMNITRCEKQSFMFFITFMAFTVSALAATGGPTR